MVSIALVMAGCGGPSRVTASSPPSGRAWLAGHLPAGFVMVRAEEQGGGRTVGYAPRPQAEPQISITASSSATESPGQRSRPVRVRGHAATLATLFDEGQPYGFSVTWDERPGLQLIVEGTNGPTEQETLAVAERVHAVSEPDWQRLLIELSPDTHMGRVDPSAVPTEALRGSIGGADYVLTALVPGGFPLGADDRRLDCYRLTYRGETTKNECPGHPVWARVGGQLFVFGDGGPDIKTVRIRGIFGSRFEPFAVNTSAIRAGPPTRVYVAPLPEGACAVSVDGPGGSPGPGATGPLQEAGADYTRCTGIAPGRPPSPPSTAA